jgi:hypothetical protein
MRGLDSPVESITIDIVGADGRTWRVIPNLGSRGGDIIALDADRDGDGHRQALAHVPICEILAALTHRARVMIWPMDGATVEIDPPPGTPPPNRRAGLTRPRGY